MHDGESDAQHPLASNRYRVDASRLGKVLLLNNINLKGFSKFVSERFPCERNEDTCRRVGVIAPKLRWYRRPIWVWPSALLN